MPVFCLFEPRLTLASLRDQNALTDDLARDHWPSSGRPFPCAECMSSAFARDRSQRLCRLSAYPHPHSTIIPGKTYVTGSGGANDITTSSREVVVSLLQSPTRFVDKVPYITAPGRTVRTVVSDLGVYEKDGESDALRLTGLLGDKPEADAVAAARAACGWDLQVAPQLRRFALPTADELGLIRLFDPRRYFLGRAKRRS